MRGVFIPSRARGAATPVCKTALTLRSDGRKRHAICSRREGPSCTIDRGSREISRSVCHLRSPCRGTVGPTRRTNSFAAQSSKSPRTGGSPRGLLKRATTAIRISNPTAMPNILTPMVTRMAGSNQYPTADPPRRIIPMRCDRAKIASSPCR
jgi:hypothetical protein